jgi:hypothetical protein
MTHSLPELVAGRSDDSDVSSGFVAALVRLVRTEGEPIDEKGLPRRWTARVEGSDAIPPTPGPADRCRSSQQYKDPFVTASPPPSSPSPQPPKKAYQAPRVQVHGDVKTITGFGIQAGVNPFATSRHLFS